MEQVTNELLGHWKLDGPIELHLRRRTLSGLPPVLEWAQFNTETRRYTQATPIPENARTLRSMIKAQQRHLDALEAGAEADDAR